jgi:hypothetical protein
MVQAPTLQIPGVYHRRVGDIVVTALSDGYLDGTVDVLQNITSDDATRMLSENFRPGRRTSVNCMLSSRRVVWRSSKLARATICSPQPASCSRTWLPPA